MCAVLDLSIAGYRAWRKGGKDRVERLMQENGIYGKHRRKYKVTTDSKHRLPVAPNPLNRQFNPELPNQA